MADKKLPRRVWIIRVPGTLRFQVCKDEEELSVPYLSLAEHVALTEELVDAAQYMVLAVDLGAESFFYARTRVKEILAKFPKKEKPRAGA